MAGHRPSRVTPSPGSAHGSPSRSVVPPADRPARSTAPPPTRNQYSIRNRNTADASTADHQPAVAAPAPGAPPLPPGAPPLPPVHPYFAFFKTGRALLRHLYAYDVACAAHWEALAAPEARAAPAAVSASLATPAANGRALAHNLAALAQSIRAHAESLPPHEAALAHAFTALADAFTEHARRLAADANGLIGYAAGRRTFAEIAGLAEVAPAPLGPQQQGPLPNQHTREWARVFDDLDEGEDEDDSS